MDSDGTFQPNSAYGSSIGTYSLPANDVYAKRFYVHTDSTTQEAVRITKESAGKGMLAVYSSGDSLEWQFGCTETGDNNWRLTDGTNTLIDAIRGSNATVEIKSFGAGDIKLTPAANREV
ncbi:MAG: hypothetical protein GTO41_17870, partial [Burkholderiales bacterium]|nr:hypothetical protein [Burkholderiales bacterium]